MKFSLFYLVTLLFACFAAAASNQNTWESPSPSPPFKPGEKVTLKWSNLGGYTVTLQLCFEDYGAPNCNQVIAQGLVNVGSYAWTVPTDLTSGRAYAIQIIDDQQVEIYNLSPGFYVNGASHTTTEPATKPTASGQNNRSPGNIVEPVVGSGVMAVIALIAGI